MPASPQNPEGSVQALPSHGPKKPPLQPQVICQNASLLPLSRFSSSGSNHTHRTDTCIAVQLTSQPSCRTLRRCQSQQVCSPMSCALSWQAPSVAAHPCLSATPAGSAPVIHPAYVRKRSLITFGHHVRSSRENVFELRKSDWRYISVQVCGTARTGKDV